MGSGRAGVPAQGRVSCIPACRDREARAGPGGSMTAAQGPLNDVGGYQGMRQPSV